MPVQPQPWPKLPFIQNPTDEQRRNFQRTCEIYEAQYGPAPQPIVKVDIPPRPLPGRKTVTAVDPSTLLHPHR